MRIPGLKVFRRGVVWARSRFIPGAVVLGYHRVAEAVSDPFGLCVSPAHFAEQLEVIRAISTPLPLKELADLAQSSRLPGRALAITFDDGYADLLQNAIPSLHRVGVPATVFVVSGVLGSEFWWDRLVNAMIPSNGEDPARNGQEVASTHRKLRDLPDKEREAVLTALESSNPGRRIKLPRCVTVEELIKISADPQFEIGGHTRTHAWLPSLTASEQRKEIRECRRSLTEIVGHPVSSFSFPFGGGSPALRREVREAGYDLACDSHRDVLSSRSDRFAIPRLWVRDQGGDDFARWLTTWLHD